MKTKIKKKVVRRLVRRKPKSVLRSKWIIAGVILVAVVILNAVSGGGVITAAKVLLGAVPTSTPIPTPTPADIVPYGGDLKQQDTYTGIAKADLAKKLDMSVSDIQVISITQKDWSDTSMGCPKRNQMYSQVVTPGYVIVLQASEKNYTYNAGLEKVVSCQ
ncbi:hypothetical protein M1271_05290 [Patescibacteria group bacterium]|nr:hypothetical protein [Patescibacteria group bacterium]MCL5797946.1 hypothetical protein [Patescibacteria group bacterium]